jgi:amino acid transporter
MWAYDGWADLLGLGGEVRTPERTMPRALAVGTLAVAVVYLAVALGAARVLGLSGLSAAGSGADMAAMRVAELTLGSGARRAMSALIFVSATGGAMASILTHSRAFVPMASDGTFFRSLGEVSERGVPTRAVLSMGLLGAVYVSSSTFEQLTDAFVVGYYPFYALAVIGMWRLRRTDGPAPFAAPLQPLWAVIFLSLTAVLVIGSLLELDSSAALAFGVLALGVPISLAYRRLGAGSAVTPR